MNELSYYRQPMLQTLTTRVRDRTDDGLLLADTIFYPGGGGQPADRGTLAGRAVGVAKSASGIVHRVDRPQDFAPGDEVELVLDWDHRFDYMQQHSGQHLVSAALWHELGAATLSVHQGAEVTTIEIDRAELSDHDLTKVERYTASAIVADHPIDTFWIDASELPRYRLRRATTRGGSIRLVRIGEIDLVACAGVHLPRTGLLQSIVAIGTERIRGHVRAAFKIGLRAVLEHGVVQRAVREVGTMLSAPTRELPARVLHLQDELAKTKQRVAALADRLALEMSTALRPGVHEIGALDAAVFRALVKRIADARADTAAVGVLTEVDGTVRWAVIGAVDSGRMHDEFLALQEVNGGGRAGVWQGVVRDNTPQVRACMARLLDR